MNLNFKFFIGINYKKIIPTLKLIKNLKCSIVLTLLKKSNKLVDRKLFNIIFFKLRAIFYNTKNNENLHNIHKFIDNFYVKFCFVNKYKFLKRNKIRAKGQIYQIHKKSSLVSIFLEKKKIFSKNIIKSKNKNIFCI